MSILTAKTTEQVHAQSVRFTNGTLHVRLGDGREVSLPLAEVPWLASRRLFYWGDIDTHGFAMLHRFRALFPQAQSLLMDRATFLAHRPMWVVEPQPSTESLTRLTAAENSLHRELVRGTHGERLRLEQERIGFRWVREALEASCQPQAVLACPPR